MKRTLGEVSDDDEECNPQNIRTRNGEPPRFWKGFNKYDKPSLMTNVVNMWWDITKARWCTSCLVEGKRGKLTAHSAFKHKSVEAAFATACEARRNIVDTASSVPSTVLVDLKSETLVVDKCTHACCKRTNVPVAEFAPDPINTLDKFERFGAAIAIVSDADATHEERDEAARMIETLRTLQCFRCREITNRSKSTGEHCLTAACKAVAEEIRTDLAKHVCCKCGKRCGRAMQCEHMERLGKLFSLLSYAKWATPELGPDAMRDNYNEATVVPICTFCHLLEPTHDKYRGAESETLLITTYKQRQAKRERENREENARINARWKAGKCCFYCARQVKEGEEHAFPWMHSVQKMVTDREAQGLPRRFKSFTIGVLQGSRICPATFTRLAKPEIEDNCELGCANCHMIYETLPELAAQEGRLERFVEEWAERGGVAIH